MKQAVHEGQPKTVWRKWAPVLDGGRSAGQLLGVVGACVLRMTWVLLRAALGAVLVLLEPWLRMILLPVAMLGFFVTVVFGFLIGDPHFPRWGMLALSVGSLWLYGLFLGLMALVIHPGSGRGRGHD